MKDDDPAILLARFALVLVASWAAGSLVQRVRLPRITGHIFAGIACGLHVAGVATERAPKAEAEQLVDRFRPRLRIELLSAALGSGPDAFGQARDRPDLPDRKTGWCPGNRAPVGPCCGAGQPDSRRLSAAIRSCPRSA